MPKLYSQQLEADAVAFVESGMSSGQVCADLRISRSSFYQWVTNSRL